MLAKVSNKEVHTDVSEGTFKPIHGNGGRTEDKNIIDIDEKDGIIQPMLWPESIRKKIDAAAEHVAAVDKEYNVPDNIKSRLGTGSAAMNTTVHNDRNKEIAYGGANKFLACIQKEQPNIRAAKCGKDIPGFKWGTSAWPNVISSGLAGIGGLTQYLDAAGQTINSPNIYAANPYERQALSTLAGLRDNPYQQLRAMQDTERRNRYAIAQSGGLTGAQKYYANVAGGIGMQKNYADILNRSNAQNNQYKANWASSALQAGQATAARQMQANQYRDEAYAKAHAARQQQKQMGMFNMINAVQQFYANEFKRNQFNKMYDLYAADVDLKRREFEANHPETNKINVAPNDKIISGNNKFTPGTLSNLPKSAIPTYDEWRKLIMGR